MKRSPVITATATVVDGRTELDMPGGFDLHATFEIGSVTKTVTGLILASLVCDETVQLSDTIGRWVEAGDAGDVTLLELATHTSGLARLTPKVIDHARKMPGDPYRDVTADDVLEDVRTARRPGRGHIAYSNVGFMLLGHVLEVASGETYEALAAQRVFAPLGMSTASLATATLDGHRFGFRVPHWDSQLNGAGGVTATIEDMRSYIVAMADPEGCEIPHAVAMAQQEWARDGESAVGLAWQLRGDLRWHNGGTGGFGSFVAVDPLRHTGVVTLTTRTYKAALGTATWVRLNALTP